MSDQQSAAFDAALNKAINGQITINKAMDQSREEFAIEFQRQMQCEYPQALQLATLVMNDVIRSVEKLNRPDVIEQTFLNPNLRKQLVDSAVQSTIAKLQQDQRKKEESQMGIERGNTQPSVREEIYPPPGPGLTQTQQQRLITDTEKRNRDAMLAGVERSNKVKP